MWQSAVEYDKAPQAATATWTLGSTDTAARPTISLTSPDLAQAPTIALPDGLVSGAAMRLHLEGDGPATVELRGTAADGPFVIALRLSPGPTTTFATVPAGVTGRGLTLVQTTGAPRSATEISVRALP